MVRRRLKDGLGDLAQSAVKNDGRSTKRRLRSKIRGHAWESTDASFCGARFSLSRPSLRVSMDPLNRQTENFSSNTFLKKNQTNFD